MKEIPLTRGKVALVDDEDYEFLLRWRWYAHRSTNGLYYAARNRINSDPRGTKKQVRMHRVLLNAPSDIEVDHIDHNGLNNQKSNLRICNKSQNAINSKLRRDNTTGYRGIYFSHKKYVASIRVDTKPVYIGRFHTAVEAALAYDKMAKVYYGEFANLNFPNGGICD